MHIPNAATPAQLQRLSFLHFLLAVLVGGDSMEAQFAELAAFPDILVATPGAFTVALYCIACGAPEWTLLAVNHVYRQACHDGSLTCECTVRCVQLSACSLVLLTSQVQSTIASLFGLT